jgi:hypothetical protein
VSLFSDIEVVDCPLPEKRDYGTKPKLDWLPLAALRIDTGYQRPIMQKGRENIARIVAEFSWSRFSPLVVTPIVDGLYAIIDGQHRATAAKRLGITDVPCQVVAVKPAEAASIFSAINGNVTPMTPQYIYKAALAAGEEWALAVDRVARRARVEILLYPVQIRRQKPRQTMIVGTLRTRIRQFGEDIVSLALEGMMSAPGADEPGFCRSLALDEAIIRVRSTPDALGNRRAVLDALSRINYAGINSQNRTVLKAASKIGQAHQKPETVLPALSIIKSDHREKILDLHRRKYKASQIAAAMKIPYADVQRVIEGVSA